MTIDISKYSTDDFNATYSPEDNKLRLYADVRIDAEDWQAMKENGWRWAPKQELFYAFWSVKNEDFCLAIAGDILPEEMTMVERAEAKAQRLLILAEKRADQCVGYQRAANDLKNRLDNNQPILLGHHSQRKAEKVNTQIDRAIDKAKETGAAVGYWVWRAQGVVGHANYKNAPRTIYNRIKTLLKDLRDAQKVINNAAHVYDFAIKWQSETDQETRVKKTDLLAGYYMSYEFRRKLEAGEISTDDALQTMIDNATRTINSPVRARNINHILNRLGYEQSQLAVTPRYEGDLTPAVIQTFLRTHGADKPKASKTDFGFLAESSVPLPLHIGQGALSVELDDEQWRDLMQSLGYDVPVKKVQNPILNFKADRPFTVAGIYGNPPQQFEQVEMTKAEYNAQHEDRRRVRKSICGTFRFKTVLINKPEARGYWDSTECAVFITDSKTHPVPDSMTTAEGVQG